MNGIRVVESEFVAPVPKLKVSPLLNISAEVREQMDTYLLEQFGTQDVAYFIDSSILGLGVGQWTGGKLMIVNKKQMAALRNFT